MKKFNRVIVAALVASALAAAPASAQCCGFRIFGRRANIQYSSQRYNQSFSNVDATRVRQWGFCSSGACALRTSASYATNNGYCGTTATPTPCGQLTRQEEIVDGGMNCEPGEYYPTGTCAPCSPVQIETRQECQEESSSAPLPSPCESVKQTVKESCETGACPLRGRVATAVSNFLSAANAIRAQYGLQALKADASLDQGSYVQANYCATTQRLIHGGGAAEILAQNYSGFNCALNQWLNSPAHRSLLLSPSYRFAGVATVRDASGRVWCAMRFK